MSHPAIDIPFSTVTAGSALDAARQAPTWLTEPHTAETFAPGRALERGSSLGTEFGPDGSETWVVARLATRRT